MPGRGYELVTRTRDGREQRRPYAAGEAIEPGDVIGLAGQAWLVASVDGDASPPLVRAVPARYRIVLRHESGEEEPAALRRLRDGSPGLGHVFTTRVEGRPVSWTVVEQRLARGEGGDGDAFLELVAERDFGEFEELPQHELEHLQPGSPARVAAGPTEDDDQRSELVSLDAGSEADWAEAERYIDALVIDEVGDDLLELCTVDTGHLPRASWIAHVQRRLRADLERFRADVEGPHDEIQEWQSRGARIFASTGSWADEADPESGHGWMVRLVDSDVLGAAGFHRVRRADLESG
jgi:hypothetical protein